MGIANQIYEQLKKRLEAGVYAAGTRFPSETALATEFSVNKMTMNKIVSMLAEQNYLVRGIRGAGTRVVDRSLLPNGTIGFLGILTPFATRVLSGVIREASHQHFMVLTASPSQDELQLQLSLMRNSGVLGIVSIGYGVPELPDDLPLVCVDYLQEGRPSRPKVSFINSDDYMGGVKMMEEILRRGHRKILIFCSERFVYGSQTPISPRVRGFHQVMSEYGLADYEQRTCYSLPHSLADARSFLKAYLTKYPDTTIIVTDSDHSAELISEAAYELQVPCPGRIALTGFGKVTSLPIANVDQNAERQGELAARRVIEVVRNVTSEWNGGDMVETEVCNAERIPMLSR